MPVSIFTASCPCCGAPVSFRSASSAMAVCGYCHSTLVREADQLRNAGQMATLLEDYSPLRIGVSGMYCGTRFTLIGRIQLRYGAGFWNEWYLILDDGRNAWLSDASGQYAITEDKGPVPQAPQFDQLKPGASLGRQERQYCVSDKRVARCVAGEGELPFVVGPGWEARGVDFRSRHHFLTLDYSEGFPPRCFEGQAVLLDTLACQLLRSPDEIAAQAGRLPGKLAALECPSCAHPIQWVPGNANHLACPACGARLDATDPRAQVLTQAAQAERSYTLELGLQGPLDGQPATLIGQMQCSSPRLGAWSEYLFLRQDGSLRWLVESDGAWELATVLDVWPDSVSPSAVKLEGQAHLQLRSYPSTVQHVAGAFNWAVQVGDVTQITEYRASERGVRVFREQSADEITWSRSRPFSPEALAKLGGSAKALAAARDAQEGDDPEGEDADGDDARMSPWLPRLGKICAALLLLLNARALALDTGFALTVCVVALLLFWLPILAWRWGGDA